MQDDFDNSSERYSGYTKGSSVFFSSHFNSTIVGNRKKNPKYVHHLGIIDYLQTYTLEKKMERFFKSFQATKEEMSVAPPDIYFKRFNKFIRDQVIVWAQDKDEEHRHTIRELATRTSELETMVTQNTADFGS